LEQATDPVIDDLLKAMHRVIGATKRTAHDDTVDRAAKRPKTETPA